MLGGLIEILSISWEILRIAVPALAVIFAVICIGDR